MPRRAAAPTCPHCPDAPAGVPYVLGLPSAEAFEAAERGEVVLGGCVLSEPVPAWACPRCEASLG
ncbi:hypothetical protein JD79_02538 [Geodermatophilus normandii]|uniref:Uncharacterized protein n=1 Tax=Geodermatophilus normandii TaxID=1137989 RepID=A0A317QKI3_9ACTN|nr:hypothetical protein [Geodermatophilus normandii]PWW23364.1 hypothetical protein JD79_02538 [Geodermatophilus normandii]